MSLTMVVLPILNRYSDALFLAGRFAVEYLATAFAVFEVKMPRHQRNNH